MAERTFHYTRYVLPLDQGRKQLVFSGGRGKIIVTNN